MSKVNFQNLVSLHKLADGLDSNLDNRLGNGRWFYSSDTEFPISGVEMAFKISRAEWPDFVRKFPPLQHPLIQLQHLEVIEGHSVRHVRYWTVK